MTFLVKRGNREKIRTRSNASGNHLNAFQSRLNAFAFLPFSSGRSHILSNVRVSEGGLSRENLAYFDSVAAYKFPVHSPPGLDCTAELLELQERVRVVASGLLDVNILQVHDTDSPQQTRKCWSKVYRIAITKTASDSLGQGRFSC